MVTELFRHPAADGFNPPALTLTGLCQGNTPGIRIYDTGTATERGSYCVTTDSTGIFSLDLSTGGFSIASGNYDIKVKADNALSVKRLNIHFPLPAGVVIDFGELLLGDANGDDFITTPDFSFGVPSFNLCNPSANYRRYSDATHDNCVTVPDFSAGVPNFNKTGICLASPPPSAPVPCP